MKCAFVGYGVDDFGYNFPMGLWKLQIDYRYRCGIQWEGHAQRLVSNKETWKGKQKI